MPRLLICYHVSYVASKGGRWLFIIHQISFFSVSACFVFFLLFLFPFVSLHTQKKLVPDAVSYLEKTKHTHRQRRHVSSITDAFLRWLLAPPLARQRRCTAITANVIVTSNRALKNHKAMPRIKHATAHSHIDAHFLP